jgi:hypothetical protein
MQDKTARELERFRGYSSADDVVTNFRRDLSSHAAKPVHDQLRTLHLPTLPDVRDEFDDLAKRLGVH